MGVITLKIDDKIERQLRQRAGELHGASKGAISKSVEEAILGWLSQPRGPKKSPERIFTAILDGKKIAEERDLGLLADDLKEKGIDARAVEIRMTPPPPRELRLGLRTRPQQG